MVRFGSCRATRAVLASLCIILVGVARADVDRIQRISSTPPPGWRPDDGTIPAAPGTLADMGTRVTPKERL